MSEQKIIELVILLSIIALAVGGMIFWLKSVFRKRREEVEQRFRHRKIIRQHNFAHFYGREAIGHLQARGNGILVMTVTEIFFLQALPKREFHIPMDAITKVSNPRSHLG